LGYSCHEELLSDEPQSPQAQATQSDLILEFRKQGLNFLSLALCPGELGRVGQFAGALSCWLMYVDGQIFISPTCAVRFLRAGSTTFGAADISMGAIANVQPDIVQLRSRRTTVAVALRQIGKSLRAIAGIVFSQSTVSRAHVRRDAAVQ
jgi:hypothetical protein